MFLPLDPRRGTAKWKIDVSNEGSLLDVCHKTTHRTANLRDDLFNGDLSNRANSLIVKDSHSLQTNEGTTNITRIEKDGGALIGFVLFHSLKSYRLPRSSFRRKELC